MFRWIAAQYCRAFHGPDAMMHPVAGHYRCRECLREWPVPWSGGDDPTAKAIRPEPQLILGINRASDPSREECERIWRR